MNDILNYINKQDEKSEFLNINSQNKLIIFGSILSSIFVVITAWLVINNTQKTILDSYHNFGSMLTKTLSIESSTLISGLSSTQSLVKLKEHTEQIIKNSEDIAYVVYRDPAGNVIYSSKQNNPDFENSENKTNIEVSQPLTLKTASSKEVVGSIQVGLSGHTMNIVGKATRNLMLIIFTIAWILSIAAVLLNTMLITRQIKLLSEGVRKISTGEFGYKITSKDLWGDIKQLFESFNTMSSRLHTYEEKNIDQLTYERNKMEAVLMSIANGVVVCDNSDQIVLVNNAALKMLDANLKEIIKTKITEYYDTNGELCFKSRIREFKDTPYEGNRAKNLECQIKMNSRIIKLIISPIFTVHEEYIGYITILHDITREAEVDKIKNAFISNVSHELRTPVTILRTYIDTLYNCEEKLDEETKKDFLSIINHESDRLNNMVNDILDFSKLESPDVRLEKDLSEIGPIIELTVKSMRVLAEERGISFSIIIEPDLPQVMLNAESIERVLKNLISNSIKYSHKNSRVKIRAEIDRTGDYLQVSIEDNGIGIPEEHLGKIFDRFYRIETKVHSVKGTGLGLHLVKIAIEKHHDGKVFVESKQNEGSTFGFKIPLKFVEVEEISSSSQSKEKVN
jgi:two-component system, OmpR family, sensor histidine kinase NblS